MKKNVKGTSFEFDADDSSDEETTGESRQNFTGWGDFDAFWNESKLNASDVEDVDADQMTHLRCAFILHQLGVGILYNSKANTQYYELKRRYLVGSKVTAHVSKPNMDDLQYWILLTLESLLKNSLSFKLNPQCVERIVKVVLTNIKKELGLFSKDFNANLRSILRLKSFDKMPLELIEMFRVLFKNLNDVFTKINSTGEIDYTNENIEGNEYDWANLVRSNSGITSIAIDDFITLMANYQLLEKTKVPNKDRRIEKLRIAKKEHKEVFDQDPVSDLIADIYRDFSSGADIKQQCFKDGRWKKIVKAYVDTQLIWIHELSLGEELHEIFEEFMARNFYYKFNAKFDYDPPLVFAHLFFEEFYAIQQRFYFRIDRVFLPDSSNHSISNAVDFFSTIRLNIRSQKRKVSQGVEDAQFSKQLPTDSCYSTYFFKKYNSRHGGLIRRQITADNKIEVLSFSDMADQLGNYQSIYKEIHDLRKMINATQIVDDGELKTRNEQQSFKDAHFAQIIRRMIKGDNIDEILVPIQLIPAHYLALIKLAINFTTLFFGIECERNPASFVTHQMILDLVINGMSWRTALTQSNLDDGYAGGVAAMTLKDAEVVKSARSLQALFAKYTMVPYAYQGQPQKSKDIQMWLLLINRQYELVNKWLDLSEECFDENTESPELIQWITDKFETWYHLNGNDVHNGVVIK